MMIKPWKVFVGSGPSGTSTSILASDGTEVALVYDEDDAVQMEHAQLIASAPEMSRLIHEYRELTKELAITIIALSDATHGDPKLAKALAEGVLTLLEETEGEDHND